MTIRESSLWIINFFAHFNGNQLIRLKSALLFMEKYFIKLNGKIFNKGATFNAGFIEVMRQWSPDCIILHDLDLLPEDDRNMYSCLQSPQHLSPRLDRYGYKYSIIY